MNKKRAMSHKKASYVKIQGHKDAKEFADLLGIGQEFKSEPQAKKDVIDKFGYSYSVKSGEKKWQIFLYSKSRFEKDFTFKAMNGIGKLLIECIESFPEKRSDYIKNKAYYKNKLQQPMKMLCEKLKNKELLSAFIDKSMFNSGEVNFLVIKEKNIFHIFLNEEVVNILTQNIEVENSKARTKEQFDNQKVVFKVKGKTIGEIEMRNESDIHYREVKFWLDKEKTFNLLQSSIKESKNFSDRIIVYSKAIKKLSKIYKI